MDYNTPYFSQHTGEEIDKGIQETQETIPNQISILFAGANLHKHILEDEFTQLLTTGAVDLTKFYFCYSESPMVPNSLTKIYFGDMLFAKKDGESGASGFPYNIPIIF